MKKPIATAKKYLKPLSWMAVVLFLFLIPCQQLSSKVLEDAPELEECCLTVDQVENFSEFKTAETNGAAEHSNEAVWLKCDQPMQAIFQNQEPFRHSVASTYKIPRTILFKVFRI